MNRYHVFQSHLLQVGHGSNTCNASTWEWRQENRKFKGNLNCYGESFAPASSIYSKRLECYGSSTAQDSPAPQTLLDLRKPAK